MEELRADKAAAAAAKKGAAAAAAQSRRMETDLRLRAKEEKRVARLLKQQASAVDKANKQADAAAVRADAEQQRAQVREARDAARQAAAEAREQRETDQLMRFVPPSTFKGFTSSPEQLEMHLHHVSLEIVAAAPELSPGLVPWLASPPSRDDDNWPPLRLAFLKSLAAKLGDAYAASVNAKGQGKAAQNFAFWLELDSDAWHDLGDQHDGLYEVLPAEDVQDAAWFKLQQAVTAAFVSYNQVRREIAHEAALPPLDVHEKGLVMHLTGWAVVKELRRAAMLQTSDDLDFLRRLRGLQRDLPARWSGPLNFLLRRDLYGGLCIPYYGVADFLGCAERSLRQSLTVNSLLQSGSTIMQKAWKRLEQDEAVSVAWSVIEHRASRVVEVTLASSASGQACFRVKPAIKNYQHLKERLLRRYFHTRSKSFTKRMMQYVKAYKKGQVHARAVPS